MDKVTLLILFLWFPQALNQLFVWLHWIQAKEYRFDRFKSFLFSLEGRKKLDVVSVFIKLIFLLLTLVFFDFYLSLLIVFFILNLKGLNQLISHQLRKPVFTERASKILVFSLIISGVSMFAGYVFYGVIVSIIVGEAFLIVGPFLGVLLTIPAVNRAKAREISLAKEKLAKIKPIVIGITGSYGKTTTKEFTAALLSKKYKTDKTVKTQNTEFGVARKIINELKKNTEVFVVEMGAYRKGEIKKIAQMTRPEIGMITGLEPQHLDLFGSFENIKSAKFELIESLPEGGIAVFNLSTEDARELYRKAKENLRLKTYGYLLHQEVGKKFADIVPDIQSRIIEADENGVKFEVFTQEYSRTLFSPVKGVHFIENLTGSILIARLLKVSWADISRACRNIKLPERTMEVKSLGYGTVVIDDSNNSTPKGFLAALNYLSHFKNKKRVVITPGIIELGETSRGIHKKLGYSLSRKSDIIIVTNKEPAEYFKEGFNSDKTKLLIVEDQDKLITYLEQLIESGSVILLEGRMASKAYNFILNRKK